MSRQEKYGPENLLPALRTFVRAREEALAAGFTDNGGAIHSIERIVDILSMRLCYPHLSHSNLLKRDPLAECSAAAHAARQSRHPIYIEHVMPQRSYARRVAELINEGASDDDVIRYMRGHYRLVLLTEAETKRLNRLNRSRLTTNRIEEAGIKLRALDPPLAHGGTAVSIKKRELELTVGEGDK